MIRGILLIPNDPDILAEGAPVVLRTEHREGWGYSGVYLPDPLRPG